MPAKAFMRYSFCVVVVLIFRAAVKLTFLECMSSYILQTEPVVLVILPNLHIHTPCVSP